jgi:hypothetical protein
MIRITKWGTRYYFNDFYIGKKDHLFDYYWAHTYGKNVNFKTFIRIGILKLTIESKQYDNANKITR